MVSSPGASRPRRVLRTWRMQLSALLERLFATLWRCSRRSARCSPTSSPPWCSCSLRQPLRRPAWSRR
jgi:hypothetical protein